MRTEGFRGTLFRDSIVQDPTTSILFVRVRAFWVPFQHLYGGILIYKVPLRDLQGSYIYGGVQHWQAVFWDSVTRGSRPGGLYEPNYVTA